MNIIIKDFIKNKTLLVLTLPFVLYIFIFSYIPMFGVIVAFKNFKYDLGFFRSPWCGLKNFEFFFTSPDSWRITKNTLGYNAVFIVTSLVVSVLIALLLYELSSRILLKIYQTAMFIPYFLSWVVVAYMVYAFLNPREGIVNVILNRYGIHGTD